MKVRKDIVQQDVTFAMMENRGLVFLLQDHTKILYHRFLKKPEEYKQQIREIAKKY